MTEIEQTKLFEEINEVLHNIRFSFRALIEALNRIETSIKELTREIENH